MAYAASSPAIWVSPRRQNVVNVEIAELSVVGLVKRRAEINLHLAHCCRAQDGTCPQLADLGEVQYLLGEEAA